jgi:hypothetical protein
LLGGILSIDGLLELLNVSVWGSMFSFTSFFWLLPPMTSFFLSLSQVLYKLHSPIFWQFKY